MINKTANALWDSAKGPFENLLPLVEQGAVLVGSLPMKAAIILAELFGFSASKFGKKIDEMLSLRNIDDIKDLSPDDAAETLHANLEEHLAKEAFSNFKNGIYKKAFDKTAGMLGNLLSIGRLTAFFGTAFSFLKNMVLGAGGVVLLNKVRESKDESDGSARNHADSNLPDLSIKRSPNKYKKTLEGRIDKILSE